ncbi:hypothetical protein [Anaerospora hongkongensis]|uniref:hypothetical protein n=1 Tax=Anaerospora hongkongensis TaxID=244830 RepID=UPI00289DD228|nr:hypothetical protein [Anaerospora hongkongensis]
MSNQSQIAVVNDYPAKAYNLLIPVKTMQEISPMHKVVVNEVQINPDPTAKDVYKEKNGEFALTKKALAKLMAAANIQIIDSSTVLTTKCKRCAEIAKSTKMAPNCGVCTYADDIAHQVTIAVPEPSGTWRTVRCTKEIRMADEKAKMSDAQYKSFYPFRSEQCESKALNRALREALMINSTYKGEELKKPFVVAYIVPNMADPEMKKIVASQYANSMSMMFGGKQVQQLSAAVDIGPDDEPPKLESGCYGDYPDYDDESSPPEEEPDDYNYEEMPEEEERFGCQDCGQVIDPAVRDYAVKWFKRPLCRECQQAAKAARAAQGGSR